MIQAKCLFRMVFFLQSAVVGRVLDQTKCSMLTDGAHLSFSKEDTSSMKNREVAAGERVEFKCGVVGAPLANIRWKVRIVARGGQVKGLWGVRNLFGGGGHETPVRTKNATISGVNHYMASSFANALQPKGTRLAIPCWGLEPPSKCVL
jgi:hypothetical protein